MLVDDEEVVLNMIRDGVKAFIGAMNVVTASDGRQAVRKLESTKVDLVVTDLNMPGMNGFELLAHMSRNYRDVPVLVMTGFGNSDTEERVKKMGSLHYLKKPLKLDELAETITETLEPNSRGYIHGVTLSTFLQMIAQEQKTCTLEVRSKGRTGQLYLRNGRLIDAEAGGLRGKDAAIEIILWDGPEIFIHDTCEKIDAYIDSSIIYMLLEASRIKDETNQGSSSSPTEAQLENGIALAEAMHFREAKEELTKLLKRNPRSHEGWLWYSRIRETMKSIETSLRNAILLAPDDPDVIEETRKIDLAKKSVSESKVRRCPFCWSPVEERTTQCHYCLAHLYIHKQFFTSPRSAKSEIMSQAIDRYMRVSAKEENMLAYYYLGMTYLNLKRWEESLEQLHKTVKLAPDKRYLSNQLHILLDYVASSETEKDRALPGARNTPDLEVTSQPEIKAKKILVVEGSSTTRKVISITLSQNGYKVIEARDGLEALGKVNEERPDLILLDVLLPKMDGYQILSIIKDSSQLKHIPVIILTSKDGFFDKVKGKLAGSAEYLTKPFDPKELLEIVQSHV
ncbi:MAG: response regulator [Deltaproteobacteria bacterium]|nr:MAG: response regulator [Deltaproteobacteria bacterium]